MTITITPKAAEQLRSLTAEQATEAAVRILVTSQCGCGNAHFGMRWETGSTEGDFIVEGEGYRVVVDPESAPLLEEAEVDFVQEGMRQGFAIKRPTQDGGCGCGGHGHHHDHDHGHHHGGGCGCGGH